MRGIMLVNYWIGSGKYMALLTLQEVLKDVQATKTFLCLFASLD